MSPSPTRPISHTGFAVALVRYVLGVALILCPAPSWSGELTGPIGDGGDPAVLREVATLPASAEEGPRARINGVRALPDGSGALFVNDLRGPLYRVEDGVASLYLDLASVFPALKTSPGLASGFVSFALHPEFPDNGVFFTVHSEFPGATPVDLGPDGSLVSQHSVLTQWQAEDPAAASFAGSTRELLRIGAIDRVHNLGEIAFNPDALPGDPDYGLLYLGAGDFGAVASGRPDLLQRLDTPYGAILRIDPLGEPTLRDGRQLAYRIPGENPFADDGDPSTLGEIYAYGFRNAHRLVWSGDPQTPLFVTDIGEDNVEEINRVHPGANHGWPIREGTFALDVLQSRSEVFPLPPTDPVSLAYPVAQYDHDEGTAIAGGVRVRRPGTRLADTLVVGDIVSGRLFFASLDALVAADDEDPGTTAGLSELGIRQAGRARSLLELVRERTGDPLLSRVDLRLAALPGDRILLSTKQDGVIRELIPQTAELRLWRPGGLPPTLLRLYDDGGFEADVVNDGPAAANGEWVLAPGDRAVFLREQDCAGLVLAAISATGGVLGLRVCTDGTPGLGLVLGRFQR